MSGELSVTMMEKVGTGEYERRGNRGDGNGQRGGHAVGVGNCANAKITCGGATDTHTNRCSPCVGLSPGSAG